MQLLVSVRSAEEVDAAVAGGADIIDAKEPARGSLGQVSARILAEILAQVPVTAAVSVALGDVASAEQTRAAVGSLRFGCRPATVFLKFGFAGVRSPKSVGVLIESAVTAAAEHAAAPAIIAVAYADHEKAGSLAPELLPVLACGAGATGVLLDTHTKDGTGLLRRLTPRFLADWVRSAHGSGLLTALAGELTLDDMMAVRATGADVAGVRSAACEGGREGQVRANRVMLLRRRLNPASSLRIPSAVER